MDNRTGNTQVTQRQQDLADFLQRLRSASQRLLLLDYDGTLAPHCIRPQDALPYPGVRDALDTLMKINRTRVIIISGRWTVDLLPLLGLKSTPEIWGSHGWEQLKPNGEYNVARITDAALHDLVEADDWTQEIEVLGARCELKPGGLAIHWRGLTPTQIADVRAKIYEMWMLQELHKNLVWHDFDGGIELRAPGRDKGMVVESLLAQTDAQTAAAYLGDDLTDEDAFKVMHGRGIGILVRPAFRPTAADFWLKPPHELLEFLWQWQAASGEMDESA
ncbi:MAG: trehalose-phosphatase [Gammaproteobacteria bacterium]|nr:trehalose-phosphatase [Gammaproteobacteria bacterium]